MADWELKTFDTFPPLGPVTLTDSNGPINLTAASQVKLIAKGQQTTATIVGACTITSAASGIVSYKWGAGDTAHADTFFFEFEINWAAGGVQTVPNSSANNNTLVIDSDLEGA